MHMILFFLVAITVIASSSASAHGFSFFSKCLTKNIGIRKIQRTFFALHAATIVSKGSAGNNQGGNAGKAAPINPKDNAANISNPNKGTPGTNRQYDQNQGNRGKQLNPNQKK